MTQNNLLETLALLNSKQAAEALGISERSLWAHTSPRGRIPCVKIGTLVRYDIFDLRKFIEQSKVRPEPTAHPPEKQTPPSATPSGAN